MKESKTIAIAGNPNVGKSTIFNHLTGLHQHTGNWPGKTVTSARGTFHYHDTTYTLVDLPGTYSLMSQSAEEEIAREFICTQSPDAVVIVCDATCLQRNMNLVLQTLELTNRIVLCVNLMDEAKKKGITIDLDSIARRLGVMVVGTIARDKKSLSKLLAAIEVTAHQEPENQKAVAASLSAEEINHKAASVCADTIIYKKSDYYHRDLRIDRILTNRITGTPIMLLLLMFIFWLTISGANYHQ